MLGCFDKSGAMIFLFDILGQIIFISGIRAMVDEKAIGVLRARGTFSFGLRGAIERVDTPWHAKPRIVLGIILLAAPMPIAINPFA